MKTDHPAAITNKLAEIRKSRGVSASALASIVSVSRQTIYAIESGNYIPNTAISLRLAQALSVGMDELFSLTKESAVSIQRPQKATLLPLSEDFELGQPVQLCQVNSKLVAAAATPSSWCLPASDATIRGACPTRGTVQIQLHQPALDYRNRILLAGCDPAMGLIAHYLHSAGVDLVALHQNSSQSLSLLRSGLAHVAGTHLKDDVSAVNKLFPSKTAAVVSFALWQEGLATARANPKHIDGVHDLARKDVTLINREAGAGSRALLDRYLSKLGINSRNVHGYLRTAPGHLAAAMEVKKGAADCCVTTEASARFFGLRFIPLESVRYDFVLRKQHLSTPAVQTLLDSINQLAFRRKLQNLGGYETSVTGVRVQ